MKRILRRRTRGTSPLDNARREAGEHAISHSAAMLQTQAAEIADTAHSPSSAFEIRLAAARAAAARTPSPTAIKAAQQAEAIEKARVAKIRRREANMGQLNILAGKFTARMADDHSISHGAFRLGLWLIALADKLGGFPYPIYITDLMEGYDKDGVTQGRAIARFTSINSCLQELSDAGLFEITKTGQTTKGRGELAINITM